MAKDTLPNNTNRVLGPSKAQKAKSTSSASAGTAGRVTVALPEQSNVSTSVISKALTVKAIATNKKEAQNIRQH